MRNFGISSLSFESSHMNLLSSPIAVACIGLKFSLQMPRLKRPIENGSFQKAHCRRLIAEGSLQKAARSKATWILNYGSRILILDFGSWISDFGLQISDFRSWISAFGSWISDF